jgi:hypothetical protein
MLLGVVPGPLDAIRRVHDEIPHVLRIAEHVVQHTMDVAYLRSRQLPPNLAATGAKVHTQLLDERRAQAIETNRSDARCQVRINDEPTIGHRRQLAIRPDGDQPLGGEVAKGLPCVWRKRPSAFATDAFARAFLASRSVRNPLTRFW